jgi:hydroxymethylbilane synthase
VTLSLDGLAVRNSLTGPPTDAAGVGRRLAEDLLEDGAGQLISSTHIDSPARRQQA